VKTSSKQSSRVSLVVVKVGGSLFDWAELPRRLRAHLETRTEDQILLIAGGGGVTDQIRALDRVHGLGDEVAHRLAIRSIDLTARMLAALLPDARLVERLDEVQDAGRLVVLAPSVAIEELDRIGDEPLPASWDVTSDTIAARVAQHLGASALVLLKSTDLPTGSTRQSAVEMGVVDPMFERFARRLTRVEIVNFRDDSGSGGVLLE
jgi:aspartokinase-like uncharacterized kinase